MLLDLGEPGGLDLTPWADRVRSVDATYDGVWELPVIGEVDAPSAVLIRPDGHVAWVGRGPGGADRGAHQVVRAAGLRAAAIQFRSAARHPHGDRSELSQLAPHQLRRAATRPRRPALRRTARRCAGGSRRPGGARRAAAARRSRPRRTARGRRGRCRCGSSAARCGDDPGQLLADDASGSACPRRARRGRRWPGTAAALGERARCPGRPGRGCPRGSGSRSGRRPAAAWSGGRRGWCRGSRGPPGANARSRIRSVLTRLMPILTLIRSAGVSRIARAVNGSSSALPPRPRLTRSTPAAGGGDGGPGAGRAARRWSRG